MDDECGGKLSTDLKCMRPSIYIRAVPFKSDSSDPETFLEYLEDRVMDDVECAAQVEQNPLACPPVHVAHYSVVDVDHGDFGRMVCTVCRLTLWQQIVCFHVFIEVYRHNSFDGLR